MFVIFIFVMRNLSVMTVYTFSTVLVVSDLYYTLHPHTVLYNKVITSIGLMDVIKTIQTVLNIFIFNLFFEFYYFLVDITNIKLSSFACFTQISRLLMFLIINDRRNEEINVRYNTHTNTFSSGWTGNECKYVRSRATSYNHLYCVVLL